MKCIDEFGRFDKSEWKPERLKSSLEINEFLKVHNLCGKTIDNIRPIGLCGIQSSWETLRNAGVPVNAIRKNRYPWIKNALVPCEIGMCEPVIVVFSDGDTLELMPVDGKELLVSVNQISPQVKDGLNNSNINSDKLASFLKGAKLEYAGRLDTTVSEQSKWEHGAEWTEVKFEFITEIESEYSFYLRQSYRRRFYLGISLTNRFTHFGHETHRIPQALVDDMRIHSRQIEIVEGHDGSSYFWIQPVEIIEATDEYYDGIKEYSAEEISIEEDDVRCFLTYFLEKYFVFEDQHEPSWDDPAPYKFEWYATHNLYRYETVRTMLSDIRHCTKLLQYEIYLITIYDYDNTELDGLKKGFCPCTFATAKIINEWCSRGLRQHTKEEDDLVIKQNIELAIDFYQRFVRRMEIMLKNAPNCRLISVMGP